MTDDFPHLLAAARQGDEAAFTTLFRSIQPLLLRYLRTLGWVFTIARARLVDTRRNGSRTPVPVDAQSEFADRPASADVETTVHELMSTEAALELIGRLPPDQAEAVLLRHVAGLDVARTAEVLGKRPGAVRIATMRGLQRLRTMLGPAVADLEAPACNATRRTSG